MKTSIHSVIGFCTGYGAVEYYKQTGNLAIAALLVVVGLLVCMTIAVGKG